MPIYEYKCQKCGKTTEIMQKFSDQPLSRYPSCTGRVSKVISNCTFHLKGTGWYVSDYKGGSGSQAPKKKKETKEKEPEAPKSETPAVAKTDEKK